MVCGVIVVCVVHVVCLLGYLACTYKVIPQVLTHTHTYTMSCEGLLPFLHTGCPVGHTFTDYDATGCPVCRTEYDVDLLL